VAIKRREDERHLATEICSSNVQSKLNRSACLTLARRLKRDRIDPIRMIIAAAVAGDPLQSAAVTRDADDLAIDRVDLITDTEPRFVRQPRSLALRKPHPSRDDHLQCGFGTDSHTPPGPLTRHRDNVRI